MTILFAENFASVINNSVRADLVTRRYPGSRYVGDTFSGTGFRMVIETVANGALGTGPNYLQADIEKPVTGNKFEIILGFNGVSTQTSGTPSATATYHFFGLELSAPFPGGSNSPILVQGLNIGLSANQAAVKCKLHVILEKRPQGDWIMITQITHGNNDTQINRKNIIPSFELSSIITGALNRSRVAPASLPTHVNYAVLLADTPEGKMTDIEFGATPLLASDAVDWKFTDTSLDADVLKPVLDSLTPHIVADNPTAKVTYSTDTEAEQVNLLIAGTCSEPDMFVKVGSGDRAKLLRYNGANAMESAAPIMHGKSVELTLYNAGIITWLDYESVQSQHRPSPTPDRVMPNMWLFTSDTQGRNTATVGLQQGGPFGGGYVSRPHGLAGVQSFTTPDEFLYRDAVVQFWVKPLPSTVQQPAFGLCTVSNMYRLGLAFAFQGDTAIAYAGVEGGAKVKVAEVVTGANPDWIFVTIRVKAQTIGLRKDVEIWLNDTKSTVPLSFEFIRGSKTIISYLGDVPTPSSANNAPVMGSLYVVEGTDLPVPATKPTVASPWPSL